MPLIDFPTLIFGQSTHYFYLVGLTFFNYSRAKHNHREKSCLMFAAVPLSSSLWTFWRFSSAVVSHRYYWAYRALFAWCWQTWYRDLTFLRTQYHVASLFKGQLLIYIRRYGRFWDLGWIYTYIVPVWSKGMGLVTSKVVGVGGFSFRGVEIPQRFNQVEPYRRSPCEVRVCPLR